MNDPLARFELVKELARGGMGVVYLARDPQLDRQVAIKRVLGDMEAQELERFKREGEVMARIRHPNVLRVYEAGMDGTGRPYLVMDFLSGGALSRRARERPLAWEEVAEIGHKLAGALAAAHAAGVLHRDLKPANVLLDEQGEPVLTDFGLARDAESQKKLTQTGTVMGTPAFMPPEQASGEQVDERADVYSLAATLWSLLAGRPPFEGETPMNILTAVLRDDPPPLSRFAPTAPPDLCAVLEKAMAKAPADRYLDMVALERDLARVREGEPLAWKPRRRGGARAKLAAGAAVLALLGGGVGIALSHRGPEPAQRAAQEEDDAEDDLSPAERKGLREAGYALKRLEGTWTRLEEGEPNPQRSAQLLQEVEHWLASNPRSPADQRESARELRSKLRASGPLACTRLPGAGRSYVFWADPRTIVVTAIDDAAQGGGKLARWSGTHDEPPEELTLAQAAHRGALKDGELFLGGGAAPLRSYRLAEWPPVGREVSRLRPNVAAAHPTRPLLSLGCGSFLHVIDLSGTAPIDSRTFRYPIKALAFSPDGADLAVAYGVDADQDSEGGQESIGLLDLIRWERAGSKARLTFQTPTLASALIFTPDCRRLFVGCTMGKLLELELTDPPGTLCEFVRIENKGGKVATLAHEGMIQALALSKDLRLLYSGGMDALGVWDLGQPPSRLGRRAPLRALVHPHPANKPPRAASMALSPDGQRIAVGTYQGELLLYAADP
ncbi:MAG: WD40 repeat domain-containing serine/threonine protein kinase [Planctomycetota bacterium]